MLANIRIKFIALGSFVVAAGFSPAIAQTQYSIGNPTNEQQYMLELVNRARADGGAEATRLQGFANQGEPPFPGGLQEGPPSINGQSFTIANTAQPLSFNPLLINCAQSRAQFLNDNDQFFSGQNPHTFGGTTPEGRINAAGYAMNLSTEYNGPTTAGGFFPGPENVAENVSSGSGPFTGAKLVATVLNQHNSLFTDQSVAGRGHRMSMMLTYWREMGIGISAGSDNGQGNTWDSLYTVQNFGKLANSTPFITGVVYQDTNGNGFYDPGEGIAGVRVDVAGSNFFAISSASGGYSVPVPGNGSYNVTFSGGGQTTTQRTVTVANSLNAKADFLAGAVAPGLVANVSTRLPVGQGDNALIEGFIVQGPAGSVKKIIVRAIGPSLTPFGVPDAVANPTLDIFDANNNKIASNDNWKTTQVGGIITGDQFAEINGSGVAPSNDLESAIVANLTPGSYTAVVRGANNGVGTGVVDAFDLSAASTARLANVATRGLIQPGDKLMIGGFIIQNGSVRVVVSALGPSLAAFGITNALPDTTLQLRDQNGVIVRENDDWMTDQKAELEATGLQPTNNLEAALVQTIPPGQYTAQVRGKPEATGIGVVQVFFLQ
jgi:uncharacterized protein YkwD